MSIAKWHTPETGPMSPRIVARVFLVVVAILSLLPLRASATEVMCDTAHQDCRAVLFTYIQNERVSIDVAMWFMEDQELANAIIARKNAGVAVRLLVDPRRNNETPMNAVTLDLFQRSGLPMRYKFAGGIMHWKYMIFNGQNTVQWSAANTPITTSSRFPRTPTTPTKASTSPTMRP
jgi:phosphatidylserine/phosphatidylglycerophosphate/cardiolipin synthase-like enzyme